jgi:class 3 adenylate cyclase
MRCPSCTTENRPTARYCENCGQPLPRACPNCREAVAPTARFCSNCGFKLVPGAPASPASQVTSSSGPFLGRAAAGEPTQAVSLDELRKATPQLLAQKILAQRDRIEGERKLVTALFADIVGSTALAEGMDPEDWREVVSGTHQRVSQAVYRYEGTIAQLLGDGVLAFFGAPLTHEDDAERAVRAALEILASMRDYADELRQRGMAATFQMRVGLNTGTVVVGQIGSDLHMEYLAIGDTVNLAARIQSAADPDTLLISENTYRHVHSLFELEDLGRIPVKGKAESVQVHRVLTERKGAVRVRGISGLSSPMVGRQRELSTLLQVIADLRAGKGGIVTISGEAGLGKSRLMAEWRKAVRLEGNESPVRWVEGRCLSYGSSVAYHLGIDLLRSLAGVPADASEQEIHTALRRSLEECCGTAEDAQEIHAFLGHMLGLKLEEEAATRVKHLDGPALQNRYVASFRSYLKSLASSAPTVVVVEDLHWADPSSVELGLHVLPIAAEEPLVFVFVTRPDRDSAGWRLVAEAREIPGVSSIELHLSPLTEGDSQVLVSNLLEVAALPDPVRQLILAKAEGNPFYVEEVIRMLIDRGGLQSQDGAWAVTRDLDSIEIPDTLQGVIMARIDRLPEDAKRTLQVASVIGRRFQVKVLEMVLRSQASEG